MKTKKIEIDIEVSKWIESKRISFDETENEILRRISMGKANDEKFVPINIEENIIDINEGLFWKGILLKNGLRLRRQFKGKIHNAEIKNNQIVFNNKIFHSPSAAAIALTGTSVNGWIFWEYYNNKSNKWELLDNLRNKTPKQNQVIKEKINKISEEKDVTKQQLIDFINKCIRESNKFIDIYAQRTIGRTRHLVNRDKNKLFKNRPDLVERYSERLINGWWIHTISNNHTEKPKYYKIAKEVIEELRRNTN